MNLINRRDFLKLFLTSFASLAITDKFLPALEFRNFEMGDMSPNFLILVFDTLSAEHMSLYGYPRQTTPNLERFAKQSNVYHNHYAAGNYTTPGTASLLTGVYPWSHRAFNPYGTVNSFYQDHNVFSLTNSLKYTNAYTPNRMAQILLRQFQHHTNKLIDINETRLTGKIYSDILFQPDFPVAILSELILRGTTHTQLVPFSGSLFLSRIESELLRLKVSKLTKKYPQRYPNGIPHNGGGMYIEIKDSFDLLKNELKQLPSGFLSYYHFWPPHDPYTPTSDFIGRFEDGWTPVNKPEHYYSQNFDFESLNVQRRLYDEYIANIDFEFGRLYDFMAGNDILSNTYVMITSDHGELFERGNIGHEIKLLYQGLIHIPLIISKPGQNSQEDFYQNTSCVDLLPTILGILNQEIPDYLEGEILPGFNDDKDVLNDRSIYALESMQNGKYESLKNYTITLLKDQYKLIQYRYEQDLLEDELYDLKNDAEELNNLISIEKSILTALQQEISAKLAQVNQPEYYQP